MWVRGLSKSTIAAVNAFLDGTTHTHTHTDTHTHTHTDRHTHTHTDTHTHTHAHTMKLLRISYHATGVRWLVYES